MAEFINLFQAQYFNSFPGEFPGKVWKYQTGELNEYTLSLTIEQTQSI